MPITRAFELASVSRRITYDAGQGQLVATAEVETPGRDVGSATINGTTIENVHTFSAAAYRAARYIITATNGTDYHTMHIVIQHDGTNADIIQFASIYDNAELATYSSDISGGNVRLRATPVNSGTNTFKFNVELISV